MSFAPEIFACGWGLCPFAMSRDFAGAKRHRPQGGGKKVGPQDAH